MVVKLGILGDPEVGKSSFMRRYVHDTFSNGYGYYNNAPGSVLFLEKQIEMAQINLFLALWCSTNSTVYESALEMICSDANVMLFMFSLTNKSSLMSIKAWYETAQALNPDFIPILVGTKYDIVHDTIQSSNPLSHHYLDEYHKVTKLARRYAMKMQCSLIFISSKQNININHVIKTCVTKVFKLKPKLRTNSWNTLKALREHNITKLLRCWSNKRKLDHLIHGYLKRHQLMAALPPNESQLAAIDTILMYCLYDLQPVKHPHRRGSSRLSKQSSYSTSPSLSPTIPALTQICSDRQNSQKNQTLKSSSQRQRSRTVADDDSNDAKADKRGRSRKRQKSSKVKSRSASKRRSSKIDVMPTIADVESAVSNGSSVVEEEQGFNVVEAMDQTLSI